MEEFDTTAEQVEQDESQDQARVARRARFREFVKNLIKKFITFISFGPGVLGFLWLIGRILRR
jgi:hypothetical protein